MTGRGRLTLAQWIGVASERRLWDRRASSWDSQGGAGLGAVVEAVLDACEPTEGMIAVDLGCGTGQVTIPLARRCERVVGIDVSPASIERLRAKCAAGGISNIDASVEPLETLELAPRSVDLVVSNYALHHLRDADKARLLSRALDWLRPGGQLVVGDMMLGRGAAAEDRRIVAGKLQVLMRRGPAGWWRILKNLWRFGLRLREKPISRVRWETLAREAGFIEVRTVPIRAEASLLLGARDREHAAPDGEPGGHALSESDGRTLIRKRSSGPGPRRSTPGAGRRRRPKEPPMSISPIGPGSTGAVNVHAVPTTMASPPPTPALNGTLAGIAQQLSMSTGGVQSALKQGASITSLASQQGVSRSSLVSSVQDAVQSARAQSGQAPLDQTVLDRLVNRAFDRTTLRGS